MRKIGLFLVGFALVTTTSCGQAGKKQSGSQDQQDQQDQSVEQPQRRPGGGPGGGMMRFDPEEMAKFQTSQMGEFIKFTEGQEEKVHEINLKYIGKMGEIRTGAGGFRDMSDSERQEFRKKMEELNNQKDEELKPLFSGEQLKQYEAYKEEAAKMMRQRRPGGGGGN